MLALMLIGLGMSVLAVSHRSTAWKQLASDASFKPSLQFPAIESRHLVLAPIAASQPPRDSNRGENFGIDGERFRGGGRGRGESASNRSDYPMWEIEKPFQKDVFTFVRVQYDSRGGRGVAVSGVGVTISPIAIGIFRSAFNNSQVSESIPMDCNCDSMIPACSTIPLYS